MPALLLGSISTVIDTSEIQRRAFNAAFAEHGLDWSWSQEAYQDLLDSNGGQDRIEAYAEERGEQVDAAAVHATKSALFRDSLAAAAPVARPGVVETVRGAREAGMQVALVTTTSRANVDAILSAVGDDLTFDLTLSADDVDAPKPDPAIYRLALERLSESAEECVAVEDNPGGAASAAAAQVRCIAFPNQNTGHLDFGVVADTVERLELAVVQRHTSA